MATALSTSVPSVRNMQNQNSLSNYNLVPPAAEPVARSLSTSPVPSFAELINGSRPTNSHLDVHDLYKLKTAYTSKKLNNFFGDAPPLDMSVMTIGKEGLKAMLQSKIPLCYFLYSLLEDYAYENLFFFLEVERYESTPFPTLAAQLAAAHQIFESYLGRNSQLEVNVDDKVRKRVINEITELGKSMMSVMTMSDIASEPLWPQEHKFMDYDLPSPTTELVEREVQLQSKLKNCFDVAKKSILELMEGSFAKFQKSSSWKRMKKDLGQTHVFDDQTKLLGLMILKEYMVKHGLLTTLESRDDSVGENGLRSTQDKSRSKLVRRMIQGFTITMMDVDIVEEIQKSESLKTGGNGLPTVLVEKEYKKGLNLSSLGLGRSSSR
ncbi:hypothetical protein BKA69DRAFT_1092650 [Paraphysoderma sedebokerense]|nr:hypothetical protein BKA69DRAFT_1092650 [Paraphysoderma sedebokerense]